MVIVADFKKSAKTVTITMDFYFKNAYNTIRNLMRRECSTIWIYISAKNI